MCGKVVCIFKNENKLRRRRKKFYIFLNFGLKNSDFGPKIPL